MSLFLPVIEAFNRAGVDYVVVGGLAVILHGHARLTTDLDVVVHLTPENATAAVKALTTLGFRPRAPVNALDFADPAKRDLWMREKNMKVFSFFTDQDPLFDVDLFVDHPKEFASLSRSAEVKTVDGTAIRVCGLEDLIGLKESAGRPKDLEDARVLRIIRDG